MRESSISFVDQKNQTMITNENLTILVVEDDVMNQKLITRILQRNQLNFDLAVNGKEGVTYASQKNYDLIIMDIQMPLLDGIEATTIIQQSEMNQNTPVVIMTSLRKDEFMDRILNLQIAAILHKPFLPNQLMAIIESRNSKNN